MPTHRLSSVFGLLLVVSAPAAAQHGTMPPPLAAVPEAPSSAAASGVRLALVQPPDAPVAIETVAHSAERLAGAVHLRNRTDRTVSAVAVAFTIGTGPTPTAPAFRHVETVALTLPPGATRTVDVPGLTLARVRGLVAAEAPVVEVGIVGVRFTSGPAWRAAGRGSWLGRPEVPAPLVCVDDAGQTQAVDAATVLAAGSAVCQGGGQ